MNNGPPPKLGLNRVLPLGPESNLILAQKDTPFNNDYLKRQETQTKLAKQTLN